MVEHKPGKKLNSTTAMIQAIKDIIGAVERVFNLSAGDFTYPIYINAETLGRHIELNRSPYIPLLVDALEKPHEVWQSFMKSDITGKVALRINVIRYVKIDGGKNIVLVTDAREGQITGLTFIPSSQEMKSKRAGKLVYSRD